MIGGMISDGLVDKISQKTWVDAGSTQKMVTQALPMILNQLKNNAADSKVSADLESAVEGNDGSILDNLDTIDLKDGSKILQHIFWGDLSEVTEKIWNKDVLAALAPVVMWVLWKANSDLWQSALSLLSWGNINDIATSFIDKDGDGDVKDDLMSMGMNFLKKKFQGK